MKICFVSKIRVKWQDSLPSFGYIIVFQGDELVYDAVGIYFELFGSVNVNSKFVLWIFLEILPHLLFRLAAERLPKVAVNLLHGGDWVLHKFLVLHVKEDLFVHFLWERESVLVSAPIFKGSKLTKSLHERN